MRARIAGLLRLFAALLLLVLSGAVAYARADDVHPPVDPRHVDGLSLGGPIDLSANWLIKQGDDPHYADPGLDDRTWLVIKSGEPLSKCGFKDVDLIWYRTHVRIPAGEHNLALSLSRFDGSYQIFVNGVPVGASRAFSPGGLNISSSNRRYAIPDALVASGQVTIAVRAAIGRTTERGVDAGGFGEATALLLGSAPVLADNSDLWFFRQFTSNVTNLTFELLVLLIALALALTLRSEREYLALVIYIGAACSLDALTLWRGAANVPPNDFLHLLRVTLAPVRAIAGIEFVRLVLGLRRTRLFAAYEWLLVGFEIIVVFPALILTQLNEALLSQGEMGFTTACCVRLERTGAFSVVNAGHISPYVSGVEVVAEPALPLGLAPDQEYVPVKGTLKPGEKLVLMSDGVVEARSAKGELYGFDRLPGLTRMPAADIAEIAQRFGQEDDITVLTIACAA